MAKLKKRSVAPIYTVAAVWLVWGTFLPLYRPSHYVCAALASLAGWFIARKIWPDRTLIVPDPAPEQAPERESQAEPKAEPKTGPKAKEPDPAPRDPALAALIDQRDKALSEMRRLNDSIKDEKISAQIDHLERVTEKIISCVVDHPQKMTQISKFLNYYLPTTLKLLNAYDRMDDTGISGANIDGTMGKIETMMTTIGKAFDRQLDALFADEALDISSDITVMENLMAQEGLTDGPLHAQGG